MTSDLSNAEKDSLEFASRAVDFDSKGQTEAAIYYYKAAASSLQQSLSLGSNLPNIQEKILEYESRANALHQSKLPAVVNEKNEQQLQKERAEFLLLQGLEEDESGNADEAIELYSQAVELCIKAMNATPNPELQQKISKVAKHALERAEHLKAASQPSVSANVLSPTSGNPVPPASFLGHQRETTLASSTSPSLPRTSLIKISGSQGYTQEEKQVLRHTSVINGREYLPFMPSDLRERFAYPIPFSDKDGKLALSPKQKLHFSQWTRPEDIVPRPKLIEVIDCFSIKQTVVSDCSFVSSLAVSALYEKRFKKKIITTIIFPQNKANEPVYNPCGKYFVKLNINGVKRKVIIDDHLPMGKGNELLCSYSNNRNEFWISLLEKAYLKVMGGYDFPGSNSNIDLHALTGWIPERIAIRLGEADFNQNQLYRMLLERHHKGDVLTTVATGELSQSEADRAGLVPTHAYAVLDIREVMGHKLFLLKNPWSHLRWKGRFSEHDTSAWTPRLQEALKYDPRNAQMFDNGIFWIDFDSLCHFFDVVYLNWNPEIFKYTFCTHSVWKAGQGPVKDLYNIGDNPQYSLDVQSAGTVVWILLTRHIMDRDDFANNHEYITLLVYKNNGRKVYLPYDPAPYLDGVRINSPHYLCKLNIPAGGTTRYTLVISQYEKTNTIYYTLRAYSTVPFTLVKIGNPYQHKQEVKNGEWTDATAGGCANHPASHSLNPIYQITLQSASDDNHLLVDLKGPKQFNVGFDIVTVTVGNTKATGYFRKQSSGAFRSGFTILELQNVPSGTYNVIPCTFLPGQKGPFFLTVQASCSLKMARIK